MHLYGQMPDMTDLVATAQQAGIAVIEDAAQAHGAEWAGRRAGSFGAAACFSFYPAKNLGAFGDAGAVVTSRPELADQIRSLANHGRSHGHSHYEHDRIGTNSRLDALQAILLSGKLARLDAWTERRIALASRYREAAWQLRVQRHGTATDGYRAARTARLSPVRRACIPAGQCPRRTSQAWHPDGCALPRAVPQATPAAAVRRAAAAGSRTSGRRNSVAADVPAHDRPPGRLRVRVACRGPAGRSHQVGDCRCPVSPQVRHGHEALAADQGVLVGYPVSRASAEPLVLGAGARLRSGTVLYDGSTIGLRLQTGHGVVIREGCEVGDDVSVWTNSVIDYGCRIGNRVKIHCNCYVAQYSELEDDVFLAPGVTIANDLYPGNRRSAELMAGPGLAPERKLASM